MMVFNVPTVVIYGGIMVKKKIRFEVEAELITNTEEITLRQLQKDLREHLSFCGNVYYLPARTKVTKVRQIK